MNELYHHGILGQKWGQRNGPPYPLNYNSKSITEKREEKQSTNSKLKLNDKQKKLIKIGAVVAITGLAVYGGYKLYNAGLIKSFSDSSLSSIKSEEEREAVNYYTQNNYRAINSILRFGSYGDKNNPLDRAFLGEAKIKIPLITKVIDRSSTPVDVISNRRVKDVHKILGVSKDELMHMVSNNNLKGTVFIDKGFCSTSISKDDKVLDYFGDTKMHIFIPRGSKGIFVGPGTDISANSQEFEIILQRGSSFIIKNFKVKDGVITDLFLDLINQEH